MLRCQIGYSKKFPLSIPCQHCSITLRGLVEIIDSYVKYEFKNADVVDDCKVCDLEFEISGEFLIKVYDENIGIPKIGPFMRYIAIAGHTSYLIFLQRVSYLTEPTWAERRETLLESFDYYQKSKFNFMEKSLKKSFKVTPSKSELDYRLQFFDILFKNTYEYIFNKNRKSERMFSFYFDFTRRNSLLCEKLTREINLKKIIDDGYKIVFHFLNKVEEYLPILSIYCAGENGKIYFDENYYINTFDFESSQKSFLDLYEWLNRSLSVCVGVENIAYRGDFDLCDESIIIQGVKIKNLKDFVKIKSGLKKEYTSRSEILTLFHSSFSENNQIRNSIGHNKIEINTKTQMIKYNPYNSKKNKFKEISLVEYAYRMLLMYEIAFEFLFISNFISVPYLSKNKL